MRYGQYWFLSLLLLIPLIAWIYFTGHRLRARSHAKRSGSIRFSDITIIDQLKASFWVKYRHILPILRFSVITLLIIALARPQGSQHSETIAAEGIDIMLIIDVSGSMRAEDFQPAVSEQTAERSEVVPKAEGVGERSEHNRLYAAKMVIKEFLRDRQHDRIGLITFAGKSYTQCPLTLDYDIFTELLNNVEIGIIEDGTAIGLALANAINRLKDSTAKSKVAILLTDGENNKWDIDPITAARAAATMNIKIYTIGVGKKEGAPIPVDTIFGVDYQKVDGKLILTKLDEETLQRIAQVTGAHYFLATDERKLSEIYREIGQMETTKLNVKKYVKYRELAAYFLFPAALLLLLEVILTNTRLRKIP